MPESEATYVPIEDHSSDTFWKKLCQQFYLSRATKIVLLSTPVFTLITLWILISYQKTGASLGPLGCMEADLAPRYNDEYPCPSFPCSEILNNSTAAEAWATSVSAINATSVALWALCLRFLPKCGVLRNMATDTRDFKYAGGDNTLTIACNLNSLTMKIKIVALIISTIIYGTYLTYTLVKLFEPEIKNIDRRIRVWSGLPPEREYNLENQSPNIQ